MREEAEGSNEEHISKLISKYEIETQIWTPKLKSLPAHLCSFSSAMLGTDLFIAGGLTPAGFSDCIYRVDLEKMKSTQVLIEKFTMKLPTAPGEGKVIQTIASCMSASESNKCVFVFGGSTYESETNAIFPVDVAHFKSIETDITKNIVM